MTAKYECCRCVAMEIALRERRKYIHVGSRATSLLRSVPQSNLHGHTSTVSSLLRVDSNWKI